MSAKHRISSMVFSVIVISILASSTVVSQSLQKSASKQGTQTIYVNGDGVEYHIAVPFEDKTLEQPFNHGQQPISAVSVCDAIPGSRVQASPSGTDSLEFFISSDGTRIDSVYFVLHSLCGFSRLAVGSRSTPGVLIDAQTCVAKWTITCITNIIPGHRLTFDLNTKVASDSVRSVTSCGTTCAVRQFSFSLTSVEVLSLDMPAEMILDQNYPNPFNPSTTIRFKTRASGRTTLKVFDELGRQVSTLFDEEATPGSYEVKFDAGGLAAGVYFYRLQAGSYIDTKKLVLLR